MGILCGLVDEQNTDGLKTRTCGGRDNGLT